MTEETTATSDLQTLPRSPQAKDVGHLVTTGGCDSQHDPCIPKSQHTCSAVPSHTGLPCPSQNHSTDPQCGQKAAVCILQADAVMPSQEEEDIERQQRGLEEPQLAIEASHTVDQRPLESAKTPGVTFMGSHEQPPLLEPVLVGQGNRDESRCVLQQLPILHPDESFVFRESGKAEDITLSNTELANDSERPRNVPVDSFSSAFLKYLDERSIETKFKHSMSEMKDMFKRKPVVLLKRLSPDELQIENCSVVRSRSADKLHPYEELNVTVDVDGYDSTSPEFGDSEQTSPDRKMRSKLRKENKCSPLTHMLEQSHLWNKSVHDTATALPARESSQLDINRNSHIDKADDFVESCELLDPRVASLSKTLRLACSNGKTADQIAFKKRSVFVSPPGSCLRSFSVQKRSPKYSMEKLRKQLKLTGNHSRKSSSTAAAPSANTTQSPGNLTTILTKNSCSSHSGMGVDKIDMGKEQIDLMEGWEGQPNAVFDFGGTENSNCHTADGKSYRTAIPEITEASPSKAPDDSEPLSGSSVFQTAAALSTAADADSTLFPCSQDIAVLRNTDYPNAADSLSVSVPFSAQIHTSFVHSRVTSLAAGCAQRKQDRTGVSIQHTAECSANNFTADAMETRTKSVSQPLPNLTYNSGNLQTRLAHNEDKHDSGSPCLLPLSDSIKTAESHGELVLQQNATDMQTQTRTGQNTDSVGADLDARLDISIPDLTAAGVTDSQSSITDTTCLITCIEKTSPAFVIPHRDVKMQVESDMIVMQNHYYEKGRPESSRGDTLLSGCCQHLKVNCAPDRNATITTQKDCLGISQSSRGVGSLSVHVGEVPALTKPVDCLSNHSHLSDTGILMIHANAPSLKTVGMKVSPGWQRANFNSVSEENDDVKHNEFKEVDLKSIIVDMDCLCALPENGRAQSSPENKCHLTTVKPRNEECCVRRSLVASSEASSLEQSLHDHDKTMDIPTSEMLESNDMVILPERSVDNSKAVLRACLQDYEDEFVGQVLIEKDDEEVDEVFEIVNERDVPLPHDAFLHSLSLLRNTHLVNSEFCRESQADSALPLSRYQKGDESKDSHDDSDATLPYPRDEHDARVVAARKRRKSKKSKVQKNNPAPKDDSPTRVDAEFTAVPTSTIFATRKDKRKGNASALLKSRHRSARKQLKTRDKTCTKTPVLSPLSSSSLSNVPSPVSPLPIVAQSGSALSPDSESDSSALSHAESSSSSSLEAPIEHTSRVSLSEPSSGKNKTNSASGRRSSIVIDTIQQSSQSRVIKRSMKGRQKLIRKIDKKEKATDAMPGSRLTDEESEPEKLPIIHPPKRRRQHTSYKAQKAVAAAKEASAAAAKEVRRTMQDSILDTEGSERIMREFPRHNWLQHKILQKNTYTSPTSGERSSLVGHNADCREYGVNQQDKRPQSSDGRCLEIDSSAQHSVKSPIHSRLMAGTPVEDNADNPRPSLHKTSVDCYKPITHSANEDFPKSLSLTVSPECPRTASQTGSKPATEQTNMDNSSTGTRATCGGQATPAEDVVGIGNTDVDKEPDLVMIIADNTDNTDVGRTVSRNNSGGAVHAGFSAGQAGTATIANTETASWLQPSTSSQMTSLTLTSCHWGQTVTASYSQMGQVTPTSSQMGRMALSSSQDVKMLEGQEHRVNKTSHTLVSMPSCLSLLPRQLPTISHLSQPINMLTTGVRSISNQPKTTTEASQQSACESIVSLTNSDSVQNESVSPRHLPSGTVDVLSGETASTLAREETRPVSAPTNIGDREDKRRASYGDRSDFPNMDSNAKEVKDDSVIYVGMRSGGQTEKTAWTTMGAKSSANTLHRSRSSGALSMEASSLQQSRRKSWDPPAGHSSEDDEVQLVRVEFGPRSTSLDNRTSFVPSILSINTSHTTTNTTCETTTTTTPTVSSLGCFPAALCDDSGRSSLARISRPQENILAASCANAVRCVDSCSDKTADKQADLCMERRTPGSRMDRGAGVAVDSTVENCADKTTDSPTESCAGNQRYTNSALPPPPALLSSLHSPLEGNSTTPVHRRSPPKLIPISSSIQPWRDSPMELVEDPKEVDVMKSAPNHQTPFNDTAALDLCTNRLDLLGAGRVRSHLPIQLVLPQVQPRSNLTTSVIATVNSVTSFSSPIVSSHSDLISNAKLALKAISESLATTTALPSDDHEPAVLVETRPLGRSSCDRIQEVKPSQPIGLAANSEREMTIGDRVTSGDLIDLAQGVSQRTETHTHTDQVRAGLSAELQSEHQSQPVSALVQSAGLGSELHQSHTATSYAQFASPMDTRSPPLGDMAEEERLRAQLRELEILAARKQQERDELLLLHKRKTEMLVEIESKRRRTSSASCVSSSATASSHHISSCHLSTATLAASRTGEGEQRRERDTDRQLATRQHVMTTLSSPPAANSTQTAGCRNVQQPVGLQTSGAHNGLGIDLSASKSIKTGLETQSLNHTVSHQYRLTTDSCGSQSTITGCGQRQVALRPAHQVSRQDCNTRVEITCSPAPASTLSSPYTWRSSPLNEPPLPVAHSSLHSVPIPAHTQPPFQPAGSIIVPRQAIDNELQENEKPLSQDPSAELSTPVREKTCSRERVHGPVDTRNSALSNYKNFDLVADNGGNSMVCMPNLSAQGRSHSTGDSEGRGPTQKGFSQRLAITHSPSVSKIPTPIRDLTPPGVFHANRRRQQPVDFAVRSPVFHARQQTPQNVLPMRPDRGSGMHGFPACSQPQVMVSTAGSRAPAVTLPHRAVASEVHRDHHTHYPAAPFPACVPDETPRQKNPKDDRCLARQTVRRVIEIPSSPQSMAQPRPQHRQAPATISLSTYQDSPMLQIPPQNPTFIAPRPQQLQQHQHNGPVPPVRIPRQMEPLPHHPRIPHIANPFPVRSPVAPQSGLPLADHSKDQRMVHYNPASSVQGALTANPYIIETQGARMNSPVQRMPSIPSATHRPHAPGMECMVRGAPQMQAGVRQAFFINNSLPNHVENQGMVHHAVSFRPPLHAAQRVDPHRLASEGHPMRHKGPVVLEHPGNIPASTALKSLKTSAGVCALCGAEALYICSTCCTVWYCSQSCQMAHWQSHSTVCKPHT